MLFASHLVAFNLAFSTKTTCIQQLNALHFAPKHTAFSCILHSILLQIAPKQVQTATFLNKHSFRCIYRLTPILHQNQPSRESIICTSAYTWWIKRAATVQFKLVNATVSGDKQFTKNYEKHREGAQRRGLAAPESKTEDYD